MKIVNSFRLVILIIITAFSTPIFSQDIDLDESPGCMVSEVTGNVTYTEKGSSTAKVVTSGTILPEDATVMVGKKSAFTLVCDDRSLVVGKKGTHLMAALKKEAEINGTQSRFAKMMFVAKGYGTRDTLKSTQKGWGGKDSLLFINPIGGKSPLQMTTFKWTSLKAGTTYKLVVYQNVKDTPVLSALTSEAFFSFDPSQLAITTGKTCYAQVMLANDPKTASKIMDFTFIAAAEAAPTLASLMKDKEYIKANSLQKTLMEAVELESTGYYSLATEKYQKAIKMDAKNILVHQMYVAFLDRVKK